MIPLPCPAAAAAMTLAALAAAAPNAELPRFVPGPGSPHLAGPMAGRPALGDVDGDGRLDVVLACGTCCGSPANPESGHVVSFLGDGRGGFARAAGRPFRVGPSVRKVALADFDGDGRLDAAAAEHDTASLTVLIGDGRGGFAPRPGVPSLDTGTKRRPHTHEIAAADVNRDGRPDLLATLANDGAIAVLLNEGSARFAPAPGSPFPAGRHPYDSLSIADLNGDGAPDVVAPDMVGNSIALLLGDGKGAFSPAPGSPFPASGNRPGYAILADANGDSRLDVIASHDDDPLLTVLLGDGRGGFAPAPASPVRLPSAVWGIAAADADGDGKTDLAAVSYSRRAALLLRGDGLGGFAPVPDAVPESGAMPNYAAWGDVDADGSLDLVVSCYGSGDLAVFLSRRAE